MIREDLGHIVTMASVAGLNGTDRLVDYCASKFAAVGFDESLRTELAVSLVSHSFPLIAFCPIIFRITVVFIYVFGKLQIIGDWTERNQNDGITLLLVYHINC